ncbi:acetyl/propionyl/methylcrotonyl-CoA carboxylase subunit alpha [Bordetella pseudohinzii]|uniref:3-methylcrotonyl-CoA carboxylase n=2 Tax=Bordetella pseudohinzii TaxID=1331258 RepID=A0A0J6C667_9BORD|nr:acetyl/propionyl/methylcrotonyl-CoA carboxylase subunit alpha [Bordetella pseudohinzii]ANY14470.1 3-methylcrotonyl-CoA carboxylase [Bordetella pseudohinzii]KMM26648.1 3-methylcrotonyl-CoA carboxylase [Bordetella pseudohinzii]KXA79166.1 3-methylcrotonyl-CoA carboxylase [Bordetella pseudohinzii]KXA81005.1 3-methylcrotonyl-CoA carboxylase [Bordetella pseudohinzii]CUI64696.1 Acetyl-/propionyl-coenzyme A carboxylase alpha chain [Bordetella pseudohinzii]
MFTTLLIANRGEIACRVAATARRLGLRTVAVYSDADADARHVAACDAAVHIGGPEPRASYLRADAILRAALSSGAQAIHPGYGFLSENEAFAQAAADAGIAFVGPPPSAIAAMGSKSAAKALMERAGVPLVPGYHGDNQDPAFLRGEADKIGYPVLIKASAGGGGKGMRVVESSAAFLEALASCQREARASFGDDRVLIERYLQKPRHIEIQVFADSHGQCLYLFERDCSVQRRHQKVIEEAPAPGMTPERRQAMGEAAVAAAKAVGYVGAGTVEFIAEPDGRFYFMEMNTRLQVEHPVTEMITGLDLVEWQLRVAAGEPLPLTQDQLRIDGHAIEARIYAENPEKGFLPSIGTLSYLALPPHTAFCNGDIRVDGGVRMGDTITPYYDPMIAKLIVRGADRDQARARMVQALAQTQAVGVQTNVAFLTRLMHDEAFAGADLDTGLIERRRATLLPEAQPASPASLALASVAVLVNEGLASDTRRAARDADPWAARDGWRLGGHYRRVLPWDDQGGTRQAALARGPEGWSLSVDGAPPMALQWRAHPSANPELAYGLRLSLDGRDVSGNVVLHGDRAHVFRQGDTVVLQRLDRHVDDGHEGHGGGLTAPMPGKIIAVAVKAGDSVEKGQALLVMEAMKMEHTITAPAAGVVTGIFYSLGDQVAEGVALIALGEAGQ